MVNSFVISRYKNNNYQYFAIKLIFNPEDLLITFYGNVLIYRQN